MTSTAELTYRSSDGHPLRAYSLSVGHGPLVILLHGGGPDHRSLVPLGQALCDRYRVVLPDLRGFGRSVCADPARYTWAQYVDDLVALLDHLGAREAVVGGAGLGATITLRAAAAHRRRIRAAILMSVEDIEDDEAKSAEIAFMDAFAARVRSEGLEAAWAPILADLAPVIGTMVREAIPRSDPASVAAMAAIGRDRAFHRVGDLAAIDAPTLVFPGIDWRHPTALAEEVARTIPRGRLAPLGLSADIRTAKEFAQAFAPAIRDFLAMIPSAS